MVGIMWRFVSVLLLLLGAMSFGVATAHNATFTLEEVNAQVSSFLAGIQNGTLSSRSVRARLFLPSRCELAVRQPRLSESAAENLKVQLPQLRSSWTDILP